VYEEVAEKSKAPASTGARVDGITMHSLTCFQALVLFHLLTLKGVKGGLLEHL